MTRRALQLTSKHAAIPRPTRRIGGRSASQATTAVRALGLLFVASLVAAFACGAGNAVGPRALSAVAGQAGTSISSSSAQALRTCIDRWNQGNMLGWGPTLASVSIRRVSANQLAAVGLRNPALPRCTVSLAVHSRRDPRTGCSGESVMPGDPKFCVYRGSTYVCIIDAFGGYACPTNAEGSPPLRNKNAATNERGVLKLDVPLIGTHAAPPLAWQRRYPHTDGWIQPWTSSGTLRPGLRFVGVYSGSCSRGSYQTVMKEAIRCWSHLQFDPCFAQQPGWSHGGVVAACANWPGGTTFTRFVITKRS